MLPVRTERADPRLVHPEDHLGARDRLAGGGVEDRQGDGAVAGGGGVVEGRLRVGVVAGAGDRRRPGAALGEDRPDEVGVVAVVAVEVRREDGVTGVEEARVRAVRGMASVTRRAATSAPLASAVPGDEGLVQVPQRSGPDLAVGVHLGAGQVVAEVAEGGRVQRCSRSSGCPASRCRSRRRRPPARVGSRPVAWAWLRAYQSPQPSPIEPAWCEPSAPPPAT